jgi:hypothetical protein
MEDVAADNKMIKDDGAQTSFYDNLIDGFQALAVEDGPMIVDVDMESAAAAPAEEEWEQLLIAIGEHICTYWVQHVLYQEKV